MPFCECGAHVTPDFVRVFGDRENVVHGCIECTDRVALREGGVR